MTMNKISLHKMYTQIIVCYNCIIRQRTEEVHGLYTHLGRHFFAGAATSDGITWKVEQHNSCLVRSNQTQSIRPSSESEVWLTEARHSSVVPFHSLKTIPLSKVVKIFSFFPIFFSSSSSNTPCSPVCCVSSWINHRMKRRIALSPSFLCHPFFYYFIGVENRTESSLHFYL